MYVYVSAPPDWSPTPIPSEPPAPGAVVLVDLSGGMAPIQAAINAHKAYPWCPVVVVVPDAPVSAAVLRAMADFPSRALFFERPARGAGLPRSTIVLALQAAPLPNPVQLAEYIVRRTGRSEIAGILSACLRADPDPRGNPEAPSRSTLSRRLSSFGPLTARDWRTVARLIQALHRPPHPEATVDQIAWAGELDPRTLRESSARFLGMPSRDAVERPGWEWKLETVLRRFDYVTEPVREPRRRRSDEFQLV